MSHAEKTASRYGFWVASAIAGVLLLACAVLLWDYQRQVMAAVHELSAARGQQAGPAGRYEQERLALVVAGNVTAFGVGLNVCGLALGLAFAFLGLAVFLYEIPGAADAEAERAGLKVKLTRLSPGVICLLCSTVIVVASLSHRPQLEFRPNEGVKVFGQPPG